MRCQNLVHRERMYNRSVSLQKPFNHIFFMGTFHLANRIKTARYNKLTDLDKFSKENSSRHYPWPQLPRRDADKIWSYASEDTESKNMKKNVDGFFAVKTFKFFSYVPENDIGRSFPRTSIIKPVVFYLLCQHFWFS